MYHWCIYERKWPFFRAQGVGEIGTSLDLSIKEHFVPTIVNTQSEFEEIFGTPNGDYYSGYTVQNYLREKEQ